MTVVGGASTSEDPSYYVDLEVPCRLCAACLRARRNLWVRRAKVEYGLSSRTWFGTLTLRPEEHFKCVAYTEAAGLRFGSLSPDEAFAARHKIISRWITLYLKRVREQSGAKIRYLFVGEKHENELPHYHCLIHEVGTDDMVTKRQLEAEWWHGFSAFRLVHDEKALWYVAKYLGKSHEVRVRNSVRYGRNGLNHSDGGERSARERVGHCLPDQAPQSVESDPEKEAI